MTALAERKTKLYHDLAAQSDPWAVIDAQWTDSNDPRFALARQIDDWLYQHREDDTSEKDYRKECTRFALLYSI